MLNAYDIREFYRSKCGVFVQDVLSKRICEIWPEAKDNKILGAGFTFPYLDSFQDVERSFNFQPSILGPYRWPGMSSLNRSAVTHFTDLPLPDESMDRCLMVHGLEFMDSPSQSLEQIWHVLKPNGRLLVVIPNRRGFWARADHTPFGQGQPYSLSQLRRILKSENFVIESVSSVLHTLPWKSKFMLSAFRWMETVGQVFPLFSGVYIIEASKQVYAATRVPVRDKSENYNKKLGLVGVTPQPG